ncbi:YjiH family protein [Shewanella sp. C32]|uniref:YjiH family protein n=1 Tax=Shewanella electrica TaxID=515560 RepID=A0ABT2FG42_9GAMM|nr:YjiH family protein [Shewanella electrica]MCH1925448.1 YjiH family protein [Shewanella electrica]MCS4555273.1 YjiH family protein [Shewanella electrica]
MTPISYDDAVTIPVALMAKALQAGIGNAITGLLTVVVLVMAVVSLAVKLIRPKFIRTNGFLNNLLNVNLFWLSMRLLGAVFIFLTYFHLGSDVITSSDTGGLVLNDLLPTLFCVFFFAGLLLPLLLNFGLLELFGTLLTTIMRPLFNLPGRSAIDCVASWLGDGSVGILLTSKQYEDKYYTQREAAIIGTTFSAVSITFSLVVIAQVKLEAMFVPFYLTVCLAGLVAAVVVPRLPPLRWKKDTYIDGSPRQEHDEAVPEHHHVLSWGFHLAMQKASNFGGVKQLLTEGGKNVIDMIFGIIPVVMAIGTTALIIAEHTPIFDYLGMPFRPLLELLQLPEAVEASKTIVVGFADMFIPSILASDAIQADITRFVIAALSVTQLIYMSEVGALLIGSKIPVNAGELFIIFLLRTLVTLPVIAGMAHMFF